MWTKDNIQNELKEISPALTRIPNMNVYQVESSYFDELPGIILQKIGESAGQSYSFEQSLHQSPYSAPAGYFDGLSDKILATIQSSSVSTNEIELELKEIAPTLATISRQNVYAIPGGYFETVQFKPSIAPVAMVVSMYSVKRVLRYATAAIIIGIMVIAGYLFSGKQDITGADATSTNVMAAVDNLSDEDIVEYLKTHSTTLDANFSSYLIPVTETDIKEEIKDLSDEDLKQFLQQYPEPRKAGTNGT